MIKPVPAFTLKRIGCCANHHCSIGFILICDVRNPLDRFQRTTLAGPTTYQTISHLCCVCSDSLLFLEAEGANSSTWCGYSSIVTRSVLSQKTSYVVL